MSVSIARLALPAEAGELAHGTLRELMADTHEVPAMLRMLCSVMEASRQPMFVAWGAAQQLFYNAAYGTILGERHPSAFGHPILSVRHGIAATLEPLVARTYAGESIQMDDIVFTMLRGGRRQEAHVSFSFTPIRNASPGEVLGIFCACAETTDAVRAQQSTAEAEPRRKQVLDSMGEGFIVLDTDFRVLEINAEGVRLENRPEASIVGRVQWELWPAAVGTPVEQTFRQVMSDRQPKQFQQRYIGEGHDLVVDMRVYPVPGGIAVFYRDVTALATANAALRHSHGRFAAAMLATGVMWTNSADGRMSGAQPGWHALTGQSEAEYAGLGWADAVHPDDAAPTIAEWKRAVAEHRMFVFEHRVRRHDGQWRRFAIRAVPVIEPNSAVREWVGVHIDVTETFEVTEAMRASDRRQDEFLATLAHELRNPLGAIDSATALLQRPDLPSGKLGWLAGVLARQTRTMTVLLDELLDISRFRDGGSVLEPERVGLKALIEAAAETVQHAVEAKGHRLELRLAPALPQLFVDPMRTTQVFTNLLTNAVRYTDAGGRIEVSATAEGDHVCIEVADNGIGLARESLSEIFEVFAQVRSIGNRSVGGLGIGLTLARRLVELQGGTVVAESAGLGRGSKFRVVLPVPAASPDRTPLTLSSRSDP